MNHSATIWPAALVAATWVGLAAPGQTPSGRTSAVLPEGCWSVRRHSYVDGAGGVTTTTSASTAWYHYLWSFHKGKAALDVFYSEGAREEFTCLYRFDPRRSPMRLDLITDGRVELGIVKVDRDTITWVQGPCVPLSDWVKAGGDLECRPKRFEVNRPGGGTTLLVLERKR